LDGMEGLSDKRLTQVSHRRAPVDEVMQVLGTYRERYGGWNIKYFYGFYRRMHAGVRSYSWVKNTLQEAGLVNKVSGSTSQTASAGPGGRDDAASGRQHA